MVNKVASLAIGLQQNFARAFAILFPYTYKLSCPLDTGCAVWKVECPDLHAQPRFSLTRLSGGCKMSGSCNSKVSFFYTNSSGYLKLDDLNKIICNGI